MADSSSIIREFSFSLGWDINEQAFRKYDQVLKNTDSAVLAVGASLAAAGVAAFEFTDKMANSMEKLYFATRRTGTTAAEYQGFALAVQNAGGSAEGARQSLESLAAFTRNNPGGANLLTQLGVDPRHIGDAKKEMDDLAAKWRPCPFGKLVCRRKWSGSTILLCSPCKTETIKTRPSGTTISKRCSA